MLTTYIFNIYIHMYVKHYHFNKKSSPSHTLNHVPEFQVANVVCTTLISLSREFREVTLYDLFWRWLVSTFWSTIVLCSMFQSFPTTCHVEFDLIFRVLFFIHMRSMEHKGQVWVNIKVVPSSTYVYVHMYVLTYYILRWCVLAVHK